MAGIEHKHVLLKNLPRNVREVFKSTSHSLSLVKLQIETAA